MNPTSTCCDNVVYNVENGVLMRYEFFFALTHWIVIEHEQENVNGKWYLENLELATTRFGF